jgi:SAM-dependent methyltransferase
VSWDPAWEVIFREREWGRYPPEELIRFVATRFYGEPDRRAIRILEAGCGPGANLWYLAREGFSAVGIDGSTAALDRAGERLRGENLEVELVRGDLTQLDAYFESESFDAIVDVAALQHNRAAEVRRAVKSMHGCLKPGGHLFSMLLASGSWGETLGHELEPGTYSDIREGPLVGAGVSHFFEFEEVEQIFGIFEDVQIEYSERSLDGRRHAHRQWVVTAVRSG